MTHRVGLSTTHWAQALGGVALLFLSSCGPPGDQSAIGSVPRWRLGERLRIHSPTNAPSHFTQIGALTPGPRGTIYAADVVANAVFVFDSLGQHLGTIGGAGNGPGEFRQVGRIGWLNGQFFAVDALLGRVSFFTPSGEHLRTMRISARSTDTRRATAPTGFFRNGDAIVQPMPSPAELAGREVVAPVVTIDTATGAIKDTIVVLTNRSPTMVIVEGGMRSYSVQPFADHPLWELAPDGSHVVVVDRAVAIAEPRFRVSVVGADGVVLRDAMLPYRPVPIPADLVDSIVGRLVAFTKQWISTDVESRVRDALYHPAHFPPVTKVLPAADGTIWLRLEEAPGDSVRWQVLSSDLSPRAELWTAKALRLFHVDDDRVYGVIYDSLDVPAIVRLCVESNAKPCQ